MKQKSIFSLAMATILLSSNIVYADVYSDNNVPDDQKNIIERMVNEPSIFTSIKGLKRKSKNARINDLIKWYKQNGKIDADQDNFNSLGLDIENFRNQKDFLSFTKLSKEVNKTHHGNLHRFQFEYDNKISFYKLVCSVNPKYTPKIFYIIKNGQTIYSANNKENGISTKSAINKLTDGEYILKPSNGAKGEGIYFLKKETNKIEVTESNQNKLSLNSLIEKINNKRIIIQECVKQHPKINDFNETSLNTIRIISVRYKNKADVLAAMLRIGKKNMRVDNAHKGGFCVGIDISNGQLNKYGCGYNRLCTEKNNIKFENFQIPFWEEAMNLVKELHNKVFFGASSLGFDVAITENGPVAIEVNTGWGCKGLQACNGGLKKRFIYLKNK